MRAKGAPHLHCDQATIVAEHGGASDQQHEAANRHGEAHRQGARLESAYAMPVKKLDLPPELSSAVKLHTTYVMTTTS
mgnify:CR=1 FL=1